MERIGKYEIIRQIGSGATSVVYLADDPFTGRKVAIKRVRTEVLGDSDLGQRFRRLFLAEASLAGKLRHPHIVSIYDAEATEQDSYIVMEYVPGGTLEQYCRVDNLLPLARTVELMFKCCKALDFAHRFGVIHRDIKPANILIGDLDEIKISDFGAALSISAETTQVSGVGSPAYMSPEQVRDQHLNLQTDIFSLGVVMYQLLTGHLPFKGTNNFSMIYQIINVDPLPPSAYRHEVPSVLDAIVRKALAKSRDERYRTWSEFSAELASTFAELHDAARDLSNSEKFDALRSLAFFRDFGDVDLWQVVRISEWSRHAPGTPIIREGEAGSSFFILAAGEVKITKSGRLLNVLGAGECFGEMSHLGTGDSHRSASVAAHTDVTLIEIADDALARSGESCRNRFNAAFLRLLVERLQAANIRVARLLMERSAALS
jgi:serine/threonine protein kinase